MYLNILFIYLHYPFKYIVSYKKCIKQQMCKILVSNCYMTIISYYYIIIGFLKHISNITFVSNNCFFLRISIIFSF